MGLVRINNSLFKIYKKPIIYIMLTNKNYFFIEKKIAFSLFCDIIICRGSN